MDKQAEKAFGHASDTLRLTSNLLIDLTVANNLIERASESINRLSSKIPTEANHDLAALKTTISLLSQIIRDMNTTNQALLQSNAAQYNDSLTERRDAWINVSSLSPQRKEKLKETGVYKPEIYKDPAFSQQAGILSQTGIKLLKPNSTTTSKAVASTHENLTPEA